MASRVEHDPEVLLLAFRYVAGELSPGAAEEFEARLDGDQQAREAVARAVELTGAVASLPPDARVALALALPHRRLVQTLVGLAGLAAAACLAWLVLAPHPHGVERGAVATRVVPSATVTLAWSTLHQEQAADKDKDETSALLAANDDLPAPAEADDAADPGLPLWLLDAASLARRPDHAVAPVKEL